MNYYFKTPYKILMVIFTLTISGCNGNNALDDEKYTCWVVDKNVKTCDPSKISESKDLSLVVKKAGLFCKLKPLFSTEHKSQVEARGVNTSLFLRSTEYRCTWGSERYEDRFDDGCEIAGSIKRQNNIRIFEMDHKTCGQIETWDREKKILYGVVDHSYAKKTCEIFINRIPSTQVDKVEILPVDVIACEKFVSKSQMLRAYSTLIKSDIFPRRGLWQSICSQFSGDKNEC